MAENQDNTTQDKKYDFNLPESDEEVAYTRKQFQKLLQDRWWRLNHLYHIKDEDGNKVIFKPENRKAQRILHDNLWYNNIVPKARQLGVTTFFTILYLDQVLFNNNITAGIIAHRMDDAKKIFSNKVQFAWDHMHPWVKENMSTEKETTSYMKFDNGSSIFVDLSTRSGTVQLLHISEFSYTCQKNPGKAEEIVTGALNSVHSGNIVSIESTARGTDGYFHKFCKEAEEIQKSSQTLTEHDFRLFFFPWYMDPKYSLDADVTIPKEKEEYFNKVEQENHFELSEGQKKWYVKKENRMGHKMKEEFPTTMAECFEANTEGAYYSKWMTKAYEDDRITRVPHDSSLKVDTYWDIGMNDLTVIILVQQKGPQIRIIDMYWNSGEGMSHYVDWLDERRKEKGYRYGRHYLPHDAAKRSVEGRTTAKILRDEGLSPQKVCERTGVQAGIRRTRSLFSKFFIDNKNCQRLIKALKNYRKEWNDKRGVYKDKPLHNEDSHFADPVRLLSMEYTEDASGSWSLDNDMNDSKKKAGFFG